MANNKQIGVIEMKVDNGALNGNVSDQTERRRKQLQQLHQAIKRSDLKLIHSLILEENLKPSSLETPQLFHLFELAVLCYDRPLISELLKYNIKLESVAGLAGGKLLWHAMGGNDLKIASMLLFAGVNLEVRNFNDAHSTLLLVLAQSNDSKKLQFAEIMMDHGADINVVDSLGKSVLFHSLSNNKANSLLRKLLQRDVVVHDKVFEPLATHSDAQCLLPILINKGCDSIETRNRRAKIAIRQLCQKSGNVPALKVVLDLVKLPFEEIDEEQNLLIYAIECGRLKMIKFLLWCGADVNQVSKEGIFPLHEAVSHPGGCNIAELLIEKGANIHNYLQHSGQYPIHIASQKPAYANIQLLLHHGADITVVDFEGRTPYSLFEETWGPYELRTITHREFIKRFAILIANESIILEDDLKLIKSDEDFNKFLDACLKELEVMKTAQILDVSLFSILSMSVEKLSILTKNDNFMLDFYGSIVLKTFSIYQGNVNLAFKKAENRRQRLLLKEEALYDALLPFLPDLVIEYIAVYLWWCD